MAVAHSALSQAWTPFYKSTTLPTVVGYIPHIAQLQKQTMFHCSFSSDAFHAPTLCACQNTVISFPPPSARWFPRKLVAHRPNPSVFRSAGVAKRDRLQSESSSLRNPPRLPYPWPIEVVDLVVGNLAVLEFDRVRCCRFVRACIRRKRIAPSHRDRAIGCSCRGQST